MPSHVMGFIYRGHLLYHLMNSFKNSGVSQLVNITRNTVNNIQCPGEFVYYTCVVYTPQAQWFAEPHITFESATFFTNNKKNDGQVLITGPNSTILVRQISSDPLVTAMTISGNLVADMLTVTCGARLFNGSILEEESMTYISESEPPKVGDVIAISTPACVCSNGSIFVSFEPLPSRFDVIRYIINCPDDACVPTSLGSTEGWLNARRAGNITINVYAVNRCNRTGLAREVPNVIVDQGKVDCNTMYVLLIIACLVILALIVILITILLYFILLPRVCYKDRLLDLKQKDKLSQKEEPPSESRH